MHPFIKKSSALFLSLAVLLAVLNCLCWAQVASQTCHAQMADCCCDEEGEVAAVPPDLAPTLLPSVPKLPGPEIDAGLQHPLSHLSEPFPIRQTETSRISSSRASPALYILNTSLLI